MSMRAIAVIAAGGSGERLGAQRPKALVVCAGRPLLAWCLEAAFAADAVAGVVVAAHGDALAEFESVAAPLATAAGKPVQVVPGGASRSHSVRRAVAAAPGLGFGFEAYAVHDAARPLAPPELFDACIADLAHPELAHPDLAQPGSAQPDCVVAAAPVTDTIKVAGADLVVRDTPDRAALWAVQTPQVFLRASLEQALDVDDERLAAATDDASLAEAAGARVRILKWDCPNPKVTTAEDLRAVEAVLVARAVG